METKKIILVVIVILVIALAAVLAYSTMSGDEVIDLNVTDNATDNNTTDVIMIDDVDDADNKTVGDDSPRNDTSDDSNQTYRVYNPQADAYVTVVGEGYDDEVDRWYTYDTDGVRYYNTRIN